MLLSKICFPIQLQILIKGNNLSLSIKFEVKKIYVIVRTDFFIGRRCDKYLFPFNERV